jgi:hypothetical protein
MYAQSSRRIFLGLLVAIMAFATAGTAVAKQHHYPPDTVSVGVSDSTVTPGQRITVTGDRWQAGARIDLGFHSTPVHLGSATARADGSFSAGVSIPSNATAGTHSILATGIGADGVRHTASTTIQVLAVVSAGGSTAFTGAEVQLWMFLAVSLFGLGLGLILVSRRRRANLLP